MVGEFGTGFFFSGGRGGYSLVQGFFCLKAQGFWVVSIFAPIRSSLSLEIQSTPTGLVRLPAAE